MILYLVVLSAQKRPEKATIKQFAEKSRARVSNSDSCVGYYSCVEVDNIDTVAARYNTDTSTLQSLNPGKSLSYLSAGTILKVPIPCSDAKVDKNLYMDDPGYPENGLNYITSNGAVFLAFCRMDTYCRSNLKTSITRFKSAVTSKAMDTSGNLLNSDRAAHVFFLDELSSKPSRLSNRHFELRKYTVKISDTVTRTHYTVIDCNGDEYDPARNFISTYGSGATYTSSYFKSE